MTELTQQHSASDAVGIINANLESQDVDVTLASADSASAVCTKLNGAFSSLDEPVELTQSMSGSEFVAAVNANMAALEEHDSGMGSLKILHWSDAHSSDYTTPRVNSLMNPQVEDGALLYAIFTGDASHGYFWKPGGVYPNQYYDIDYKSRFLMCAGNHDVYDRYDSGGDANAQKTVTERIRSKVTSTDVMWGDTDGVNNTPITASYCYRDIEPSGANKKVRIIVLDQYEINAVGYPSAKHLAVYSQKQIDWLIATLKSMSTDGVDYFIIVQHEPPVKQDYGGYNTIFLREARRMNKFIAATNGAYPESMANHPGVDYNWCAVQNGGVIAKIVNAYLTKSSVNFSFHNLNNGESSDVVTVNEDFSGVNAVPFLFYLCGHIHREYCGYHPEYPNQLILCVDCAKWDAGWGWSDLERPSNADVSQKVVLNKVTVNFATKKILVERIGEQAVPQRTVAGVGYDAITRDSVTFNFKRKNEEWYADTPPATPD